MSCSIMDKKFQLLLEDTKTNFNLSLGGDAGDGYLDSFRGALQRPDLSRVQIAALLRKAAKKQRSIKSQEVYWKNFMTRYVTQNANTNAA